MAELRAGGLALVIGAGDNSKCLIGHTVELVELVAADSWVSPPGEPKFFNPGKARWLINKAGLTMTLSNGQKVKSFALLLPKNLLPIDGDDFRQEKESEKQLQNA